MLAAIGTVLFVTVVSTFVFKERAYGSTPFYYSAGIALKEALTNISYPIQYKSGQFRNTALAALGFQAAPQETTTGNAETIPILAYHRIVTEPDGHNVTVAQFKDQMESLKHAGWRTVTLAEFDAFMRGQAELPARSLLITFDDGTKDSFYPVDPIFKALGFNGVSYIIVHGNEIADKRGSTYYLSTQEIKRMIASGRWEIGSHSYSGHTPYPINSRGDEGHFFSDKLYVTGQGRIETAEEFRIRVADDLAHSKTALENNYSVSITTFAFPFGDSGEDSTNYKEAHNVVIREADKVYDWGFVQTRGEGFNFNRPSADAFLAYRITVLSEWSGEALVSLLEHGYAKTIPYETDFSEPQGWTTSWGTTFEENNELIVRAPADKSSSSALLQGTGAWGSYDYRATTDWHSGYALLLGAVRDSKHYRSCSYSEGKVRLQETTATGTRILGEAHDLRITHGNDRLMGMRIEEQYTSCMWGGHKILTAPGVASLRGGIGVQVWDETLGTASLTLKHIRVTSL